MDVLRVLRDEPLTTAQLVGLGVSEDALRRALRRGQVRRLHHGVHVRADLTLTASVRLRAAVLATPLPLVAGHETAAELWDVDVAPPGTPTGDRPVRGYVPGGTRPPRRPGLRLTAARLPPEEIRRRGDLLLTSPTRTAIDLARERDVAEAVVVLDAFLHRGLTHLGALQAGAGRLAGRRGVALLREAVVAADGRAESPMESRLRMLLVRAGLPPPVPQHEVRAPDGRLLGRVDLAYVEQRLALEYDGREHHLEPGRFQHDRHRSHDLLEAGWAVLRFTAHDVLRARDRSAALVRRFLGRET